MPETTAIPRYQCPWCGRVGDVGARTCTACGAAVDVRLATTDSGWTELPPIRDMAKLQFGQSFCQVEGKYVPVADFKLAAGDGIYFPHHLVLWKENAPAITAMPLARAIKRLFAGLPMVMTQATGPGRIAFSKDAPGELLALPLSAGQSADVREHVFMVATHSVSYDWFGTGIWFRTQNGKDSETHYPLGAYMDRFTAGPSPGLLLLHGEGNLFVRRLQERQSILIQPSSLLFKDPTVRMHLHFEKPGGTWQSWRSWGDRYIWLKLTGPGRVAIQSRFRRIEDNGARLSGSEPLSTHCNW
jgi:uncharacterized protein (AIM24 family)